MFSENEQPSWVYRSPFSGGKPSSETETNSFDGESFADENSPHGTKNNNVPKQGGSMCPPSEFNNPYYDSLSPFQIGGSTEASTDRFIPCRKQCRGLPIDDDDRMVDVKPEGKFEQSESVS